MGSIIEALDYEALFSVDPFGFDASEKSELYDRWLAALQAHHASLCEPYARLVEVLGDNPLVPVRLFKEYDLKSTGEGDIAKVMTSSGTTSQVKSKINLDRATSARQSKALSRIVGNFLGTKSRVPMLVIDAEGTVKNRSMFSARTAGIRGFSMLGRDVVFALNDDMTPNWEAVADFAERHANESCLIFGFTFIVWSCFVLPAKEEGRTFDLNGILVHGGGWKKLVDSAVSAEEFSAGCRQALGKVRTADYYGMVEQTGSISMQCECGRLHASLYGDIEILDPFTLEPVGVGQRGLIKTVSLLPTSYPGHILLTEDEGELIGIDDCSCGRKGCTFKVYGRQKGAEIRGCSDTYER